MMSRRHLLMTSPALLSACATPAPLPTVPEGLAAGEQRAFALAGERMWVALPPGYAQRRQPWPLLVFLHGSGEREQCPSTYEAWRARRVAVLRPARTRPDSSRYDGTAG